MFTFKGGYCVVTDNINSLRKVTGFSITGNKPERGREGRGEEGGEGERDTNNVNFNVIFPYYSKAIPRLRMQVIVRIMPVTH